MNRVLAAIIVAFAALLPQLAHAFTVQEFSFGDGDINANWQGIGPIAMQQQIDGIVLSARGGTGSMLTEVQLSVVPQAGFITTSSSVATTIFVVWVYNDDPLRMSYDVPVQIAAGQDVVTAFSLASHKHWHSGKKSIGIALPTGSSILLKRFQFVEWNIFERSMAMWQSLWTFDTYSPQSINFVWGPYLANNPIDLKTLFKDIVPKGTSATYVLLWATFIALSVLTLVSWFGEEKFKWKKVLFRRGLILLGVLWIVTDLRMGTEFLRWIQHDATSYVFAPTTNRTFRDRGNFYDFATFAKNFVQDRKSYVFFAEQMWPYLGNMRYITYPAIPGIDIKQDDTWVLYNRPDIVVGPTGQLMLNEEAISAPGRILGQFDNSSFIFRIGQP